MEINLKSLEQRTFEEDDSPEIPPPDIVAYNELRSCADLHRMVTQRILEIQPEFQRQIVWRDPDQTRFIDSLVKQLPIPSMCFALDYKKQRWQVIDGLQRIYTINRFLSDGNWKLSNLKDVDPDLAGKKVADLMDESSNFHYFFTRVENLTLPITVLRCEFVKKSHFRYLFTIFHRLNTGGMKLNNQEIRNCIFSGSFNNLLKELDSNEQWRKINRMKRVESYRFTKQELILRFFAFRDGYQNYTGALARFLNDYMGDNRESGQEEIEKKRTLFERTVDIIYRKVFGGKIPHKVSLTLLEALLVGVSYNLDYLGRQSLGDVKSLYEKLQRDEELSEHRLSEGLSKTARVRGRMEAAKVILSGS